MMAQPNSISDNFATGNGAIAMHAGQENARYQVGDPGRYLAPGLFQMLLAILDAKDIDPKSGYDVRLTDPITGITGRITGFATGMPGIVIPDTGNRDLGEFVTDTGHLAIADIDMCVDFTGVCDHCLWIGIEETFTVVAAEGLLVVNGSTEHVRFATRAAPSIAEEHIRQAA